MGLAPESTPRRFDVLQQRLDELTAQQQQATERKALYQDINGLSALAQLAAVKAHPIQERLQYSFTAPQGQELRAALLEQTADLPATSSGIANKPFHVKIGIIADLFLYKSFEGLANFVPIYPQSYQQHTDIDVLLMVSTWRGVDGVSWKGVTTKSSEKREQLFEEILPFYRQRDVPIVFYSKEDPPNYNHFLPFAQQADHVFTSAEEVIPKYERDCPEAKTIQVLPFGINPKHHSPIGSQQGEIQRIVPFAGSWFNHKYEDRSRWGNDILDAVVASDHYDLLIFDRNSNLHDVRYNFPKRFAHTVTPAIDHEPLLDIQRIADVSINLNSVSNSSTMFANRAIELQAQGTFVLSNYNVGLNSRYPHVHLSNGYLDTLAALNSLGTEQIRAAQASGIRAVYSHDLALMRIAKILATVGLSAEVTEPRVIVVADGTDETLQDQLAQQTYANILDVVVTDEVSTPPRLNEQTDIVVHVNTAYDYAPTHVVDLVNAFRYTDARTVEKAAGASAEITRHQYATPENVRGLGAEYVANAHDDIAVRDGYRIDNIGVKRRSESITVKDTQQYPPPVLSVVVPIYNNGPHLLHKCIASLRRSSIFDQMEIILVDDGSTDIDTVQAVIELEHELPWVQVYRYEPGGSGSASRPRNKGLELATCDYVTYLDPDNEALNDAYVKLLHQVISQDVDFAVGDMTRWRASNSAVRYTKFLHGRLKMDGIVGHGGAQALVDMQFMPISIQALVARTDWLRSTGISQPVGAVGQDSYFFQQMLYYARRFSILRLPAHTYYAQVENSVVNTVNARFFTKYLPLERARSQWLTEVGLLEDYKRTRMETFFTGWYLRKLVDVPTEQRAQAISTIIELGQIYGDYDWQSEEARAFWSDATKEVSSEHNSL